MRFGTVLPLLAFPLLTACAVNATNGPAPEDPPSAQPESAAGLPPAAAPTAPVPAVPPTDPKPADKPTSDKPAELPPSPATTATPAVSPPVVGGYTAADTASAPIQSAAAEAVKLLQTRTKDRSLTLEKIRSAQTQVVAGTNYRLELDVKTGRATKAVTVVLYKDLQGGAQLTSVEGL